MRKFFLPVIFVVVLIISFSFSTFAAAEPFYVFDLSNLDAIGFQFQANSNQDVVFNKTFKSPGVVSFVSIGSETNLISGLNGIFNFLVAAEDGSSRVFFQSGVAYSFKLLAWNITDQTTYRISNCINQFTLAFKNTNGDVVTAIVGPDTFTTDLEYVEALNANVYALRFTIDGSLYPGFELVSLSAKAVYDGGTSYFLQAFYDFNISAVNVSDKHWDQNITGTAPPGSDQANSNHNQEQDILNSISGGVSNSNNLFSNAISLWSDWVGSIALVTRIFNSFTDLPVISVLLVISLSFGISGFLFNLGSSFVRRDSRSKKGGG